MVGTAADPVIVGRTEFTAGDIFLMNKRYQIERGIIEFSNPHRTEPVLNVLLTTTINQYNLSLTFLGPLDKMQTSYVSDPPLPTADIINLIARGQTTQQAAASPSNFGASSLLAQGAASQVSGGVQKLAGLSSLSIDPTLGGNNSNPGARIAMQKRVTNNFLFCASPKFCPALTLTACTPSSAAVSAITGAHVPLRRIRVGPAHPLLANAAKPASGKSRSSATASRFEAQAFQTPDGGG